MDIQDDQLWAILDGQKHLHAKETNPCLCVFQRLRIEKQAKLANIMFLLHNTTTIYGVFSTLLNLRALTKNQ